MSDECKRWSCQALGEEEVMKENLKIVGATPDGNICKTRKKKNWLKPNN